MKSEFARNIEIYFFRVFQHYRPTTDRDASGYWTSKPLGVRSNITNVKLLSEIIRLNKERREKKELTGVEPEFH